MAPQSTDTAGNAITDPIVSVKCLYLAPCWSVLNTKCAGALACDISLNMFSGTLRRGTSVPHETRTKKKKNLPFGEIPRGLHDQVQRSQTTSERNWRLGSPGEECARLRVHTEGKRLLFCCCSDKTLFGRRGTRAVLKWNNMHFSISLALKVPEQPAATCQRKWFLLSFCFLDFNYFCASHFCFSSSRIFDNSKER